MAGMASMASPSMASTGEELGPAAAYSAQVAAWLHQAYHAQMLQVGFPSFLAYQASLGRLGGLPVALGGQPPPPPPPAQEPPTPHLHQGRPHLPRLTLVQAGELSIFTIPPVWKRAAAETIDFFILIVLKVMITFIAVDFFELVDLEQYQLPLDLLSLNPDKLDVRLALQFTQEILVLELVHRMVVCLFEALCTHRGPPGMPGGATPGKVIMGLRIIRCNQVTPLGGSRVRVLPASDLGLGWAAVRSILKNFSLAFFFPVCFSLLFLPYSRTLYDVMARSIVVESNLRLGRLHRPHNN